MPDLDRLLAPNPFAGDNGERTDAVAQAFSMEIDKRVEFLLASLGRVFMAVLPHQHPGRNSDGSVAPHDDHPDPRSESAQDFVLAEFPGGRRATPLFTSAKALAAFNPHARPAPITAPDLARLAVKRSNALMVIDPGSQEELFLGRSAVLALASQTEWIAPWHDAKIAEILNSLLKEAGFDTSCEVKAGDKNIATLDIVLKQEYSRALDKEIISCVLGVIESIPYVRARLDVVEIIPRLA
ncbi:SseB family protein [Arcanobacterium ihumii]|uniref:SseB family protein n=1 Tax=Arcanobacterium ihumii TaxID=2138162 RepID=UPI000F533966|nr:SseB family protein [Arcanobacterium ihumii]